MDVLEELRQLQLLRKEQAREQAYMARLAHLEREREAQLAAQAREDEQEDSSAGGVETTAETAAPLISSPVVPGGEESGRKRRRQVRSLFFAQQCVTLLIAVLCSFSTASGLPSTGQGAARGQIDSTQHKGCLYSFYSVLM